MPSSRPSGRAKGAKRRGPPGADSAGAVRPALAHRLALLVLGLAMIATPMVYDEASRDAFRTPKALVFGLLALLSLFFLSFGWGGRLEPRRWLTMPASVAIAPFVVVATLVSLASPYRAHVAEGLAGLWIGAAALWGWSAGFDRRELLRAMNWALLPAALLAAVGALQFHDLFQPFDFAGLRQSTRLAITSFAGNPGDLAAFLVLPALVAQRRLAAGAGRIGSAVALALALYGVAITQTLAAAAALGVGTVIFWAPLQPVRRRWLAVGATAAIFALAFALSGPFRERALTKTKELARGDWNELLTGRLDGWRAGVEMLREHPATGVGAGAFAAAFLPAREALLDRGVPFFAKQVNVVFSNAHNEVIEVAAELGVPGLLALAWAIWRTWKRARTSFAGAPAPATPADTPGSRAGAVDRAFAGASLAAIAVLSLFHFPFAIAIVASQILLFLAWLFAAEPEPA